MKTLTETLLESITESFNSGVLSTILTNSGKQGKDILTKKRYKFNKIEDADFEDISKEEALTLYRKQRNSDSSLWFLDANGAVLAISDYPRMITWYDKDKFKSNVTINQVLDNTTNVKIINNISRFDTTELKRSRAEAQSNALALKTEKQVAEENRMRYETQLLKLRAAGKDEICDLYKQTMEVYLKYITELNKNITDNFEGSSETLTNNLQLISRLSRKAMNIQEIVESYVEKYEYVHNQKQAQDPKQLHSKAETLEYVANNIKKECKELMNMMN